MRSVILLAYRLINVDIASIFGLFEEYFSNDRGAILFKARTA